MERQTGGRRCTICFDPRVDEIEKCLVESGWGFKYVASQFGVGFASLFRHHKNHMGAPPRRIDELRRYLEPVAESISDEGGGRDPPRSRRSDRR